MYYSFYFWLGTRNYNETQFWYEGALLYQSESEFENNIVFYSYFLENWFFRTLVRIIGHTIYKIKPRVMPSLPIMAKIERSITILFLQSWHGPVSLWAQFRSKNRKRPRRQMDCPWNSGWRRRSYLANRISKWFLLCVGFKF